MLIFVIWVFLIKHSDLKRKCSGWRISPQERLAGVNTVFISFFWLCNSWAQSHTGNALLLTGQNKEGSCASSLGGSAAAGYPEGQGWMPGALAPPFYPFGCSRSHPANANGEEWGAGYSGREGACTGLLGLTRRSFWWEITQALSSLSMGAGGGDFLLLTSVKGEEGIIQSVALN